MTDLAIQSVALGKRYRLGERERYRTLREAFGRIAALPRRLLQGRERTDADDEGTFWALRDATFEIRAGEAVGVVGRNGAGKSTLLKLLSRITPPTEGRAEVRGSVRSLLEVGTGFHGELSGRDNIYLSGAILGMKRHEIDRKFDDIVAFAEVDRFLDTAVKHYSSGMYVRLAFAVAAQLEPDILLIDEVLAVGDAAFQRKCLGRMGEAATQGRTVMFVSHNMEAVSSLCQRAILLEGGRITRMGAAPEIVAAYMDTVRGLVTDTEPTLEFARDEAKAAQLNHIALRTDTGTSTLAFDVATPVHVTIDYEVRRDFPCLVAYCHVRRHDGYLVYLTTDADGSNAAGPLRDMIPKAPGRYRAQLVLPAPLLNVGIYELEVGLWIPAVADVDQHRGLMFEIVEARSTSFASYLEKKPRGGLLAPLVPWTTERTDR